MKKVIFNSKKLIPSKIVCIGRNYVEHIKELNNEIPSSMVIFNKPNSSISHELYWISEDCHFEGEICFVIEKGEIAGVGFGLDLTKRELQTKLKSKGLPWERAKAFDNSALFSEFVKFDGDFKSLRLELLINDKLVQSGGYDLMIYKPAEILKEIKSFMSLEDGDIVMTGTPKGVGTYKTGDKFVGRIYSDEKILIEKTWIAKLFPKP
ncbi:fumarylacetoacetate hydrolase family protein [Desulfohalobiaceae bacterium Ax17]|uniref:fumarylacetoacetate hydrolase family protein n=1 Tax=Desulfovulcanus ferrireducens TaxID=2831190 RepID=UPI00207B98A8|nr:fumarylacetoacetate hydrolase family protein [Desulfovulcanus ferrireducens]MBT8764425.1 fumarylacetoacetate hydrolase family protein [Desulfovulcanus ferrireducens]